MSVPTFKQLYVVSDLHMGSTKGFQIFRKGRLLANFIRGLCEEERAREASEPRDDKRIALVLNGDTVDFLAEEPPCYLDPDGAIRKLRRICEEDESFTMVWEQLRAFVQKENRHLVINLGNHDVELALPHVQHWLVDWLSEGNDAARGRITMAVDGAGYRCTVDDKKVLCLHGNEVDGWNPVDFHQLLNMARAINRGISKKPKWDANAGTRLVIKVMNDIKRRYRFVDLLKPEKEAVIPALVALRETSFDKVAKIVFLKARSKVDRQLLREGVLAAEAEAEEADSAGEEAFTALLDNAFGEGLGSSRTEELDALLQTARENIEKDIDPMDALDESSMEALGVIGKLWSYRKLLTRDPSEGLRQGLQKWLNEEKVFNLDYEDDTFKDLDEEIGHEVDCLIAGHTHVARARERRQSHGYYYNCGTWAGLIKLTDEQLTSEEFPQVYKTLTSKKPGDIDSLITEECHVVSIVKEELGVYGRLRQVNKDGSVDDKDERRFP